MEIQEKISVTYLTKDSVSILKQQFVEVDGSLEQVDTDWRRAYVNNLSGRNDLKEEVPEPYYSSIISIWGDIPTVVEKDN